MSRKRIIAIFFSGLLLMAVFEVLLIWACQHLPSLPAIDAGLLNPLAGLLAVTTGGALIIWSVWIQYTEGQGTPAPAAATKKLVTTGPYAFTRNPMTLGAAVFYLGIAFWTGSIAALVLVLLVFTALLAYIYFHETQELSERFGAAYRVYRRNTPFLIPGFRKRGDHANHNLAGRYWRKP